MKNLKTESPLFQREHPESDPLLTPEQLEKQRLAGLLVREWSQEKDGYDEEIWPLLQEELKR